MTIVYCVHFTCYVYSFPWLSNLKVLMRVRKFSWQKFKNSKFVEIFLESCPYQKKKNSIHKSFLHVLINPFQVSPTSLKEDTKTRDF